MLLDWSPGIRPNRTQSNSFYYLLRPKGYVLLGLARTTKGGEEVYKLCLPEEVFYF